MDQGQMDRAIDLLLGVNASKESRKKVGWEIEEFGLRFVSDEALHDHIPSVAVALRQLENLGAACAAMSTWQPEEQGAHPGPTLLEALAPFLDPNPYGVLGMLGNFKREILDTEASENTVLHQAIVKIKRGESLAPKEARFIADLGAEAARSAEEVRKHRGTGKGLGGAPLHSQWARHDFVVALLDIWERHAEKRATRGPGSKFVGFVSLCFEAATGDEAQEHGQVIRVVIRKWRARERIPTPGRPAKVKGGAI